MPGIRWTRKAQSDLFAIGDYIAVDSPSAAHEFLTSLTDRVNVLRRMPRSGRVVPELRRDDIRELLWRNYRIVYRVISDRVEVLTVFEGHRRLRPTTLDDAE